MTKLPGLTRSEERIMALWDAGRSIEQIAADTGFRLRTVGSTVSMFDIAGPADRDREAAIREASRRHAAALAATGRRYA